MSAPHVIDLAAERTAEPLAARVRHLQAEARRLAADHLRELLTALTETEALAQEIAAGGDAYHHGAQERARRIAAEIASQRMTLQQIMDRDR